MLELGCMFLIGFIILLVFGLLNALLDAFALILIGLCFIVIIDVLFKKGGK